MEIHIGKEIERVYQQSGMKLSEFANRINTSSRNIYSIFSRKEIKTDQLQKISEVLKFDFFALFKNETSDQVEEPQASYLRSSNRVVVSIELDGAPSTLDHQIKKITAINNLLEKL